MDKEFRIKLSLFFLRITVFLVMLMWTLDKFLRPEHSITVFEQFYMLPNLGMVILFGIGIIELIIIVGFLLGIKKTWTYGIVLVLHFISTISSYPQYLSPFESANLLFFAAWPMLAACLALFLLRDSDTLLSFSTSSMQK